MGGPAGKTTTGGLSLEPFRGLRPAVDGGRLGRVLCPPYDVIDGAARARLIDADPDNAVRVVLPDPSPEGYAEAATTLARWVSDGVFAVDAAPALYVYEMDGGAGNVTRGLLGAVELRDAADGVILPHENTMAGPVADRLEVMTATGTDLEPIYLVYDGGGPASDLVGRVDQQEPIATAQTPDGLRHRLWRVADEAELDTVRQDLAARRALIADGHHRYATYQERQRRHCAAEGPGPWDRGLALLVDSSEYGPQVHAIHRVVRGLSLADAVDRLAELAVVTETSQPPAAAVDALAQLSGFAVLVTDGARSYVVQDRDGQLAAAAQRPGDVAALTDLDVTVVHRALVEHAWGLNDDVDTVGYAHDLDEALSAASAADGFAILLRPTPVAAVAAVAAAGARMPRKSTLFTPKPASGLVMRRLADQSV